MATYMNQTNSGRIIVQQTSPSAIIVQPDNERKIILKGSGGLKGETGDAATITVGSTTTGEPGTSASVVNSGTSSDAVLDFVIPKGSKGDKGDTGATGATGPANTLSIGTVQKGDTAEATITGDAPNQTLNLTLPKGDKGDTGSQGPAGAGVITGGSTGQVLTKKSGTNYDTEWATPATYSDFTGATSSVAGAHGLVPAPTTSDPDKFLKGDGTWGTPPGTTYTAGEGIEINSNTIAAKVREVYNRYTSRPATANTTPTGDGGLYTFQATGSMTTGKPKADAHIIQLEWDNANGWDSQIAVRNNGASPWIAVRAQDDGVWKDWVYLLNDEAGSVKTANIDALAVTTAKIADGAVTATKIASGVLAYSTFEGLSGGTAGYWKKLGNVTFAQHQQGKSVLLRILVGFGNNGNGHQQAFIDLVGQLAWTGNSNGRAGWTSTLNRMNSNATTSSYSIKVIANSVTSYDVYIRAAGTYMSVTPIFIPGLHSDGTENAVWTPDYSAWTATAPSGTECNIENASAAMTSDLPTVNDATLTITQNGSTLGTFSANASSNATIDIPDGGSSYTAGVGIEIASDTIEVDDTVALIDDPTTSETPTPWVETSMIENDAVTPEKATFTEYSTTEQVVGTWIDGKPIYRKVVNIASPSTSNADYDLVSSDISTIVRLWGYMVASDDTKIPVPQMDNATQTYSVVFLKPTGVLRGRFAFAGIAPSAAVVIVEYTKTTD